MAGSDKNLIYRVVGWTVSLCYPRLTLQGLDRIPDEPVILVGNHCQAHGPLASVLRIPLPHYTWCAGQMLRLKEVPAYAFQDFWSQKPKWTHPFYKLLSYLIAPLAAFIFPRSKTVPVYRDTRILTTYRETVRLLREGNSMVIFPEKDERLNQIVYRFQNRFLDVAKLYYKKTGKALAFVPMYLAPALKTLTFGDPIRYDPAEPMETQRERLGQALEAAVTALGEAQPPHRVVPYRNIPKKLYPMNRRTEVSTNEKTDRGLQ